VKFLGVCAAVFVFFALVNGFTSSDKGTGRTAANYTVHEPQNATDAAEVGAGSASGKATHAISQGSAKAVDGDTVIVNNTVVRLKGVDAPEQSQPGGAQATAAMRILVGTWLKCELTGEKTHNREVGFCANADGKDIAEAIISQGLALACPRHSSRYVKFEQAETVMRQPRASYCLTKTVKKSTPEPLPMTTSRPTILPEPQPESRPRAPGIKCMYPDDLDSIGRRCGKRAASERPGGK
jgi:endonuclease YncB( thermonuclease family)